MVALNRPDGGRVQSKVSRMAKKARQAKPKKANTPQLRLRVDPRFVKDVTAQAAAVGMTTNSYIVSLVARDIGHDRSADVKFLMEAVGNMAELIKTLGGYETWNESKESQAAMVEGFGAIFHAGKVQNAHLDRLRDTLARLLADDVRSAISKTTANNHV